MKKKKTPSYWDFRHEEFLKEEKIRAYEAARQAFALPHWSNDDLRKHLEQLWRSTEHPRPERSETIEAVIRAVQDELASRGATPVNFLVAAKRRIEALTKKP